MRSGKPPRVMGNCSTCCYATYKGRKGEKWCICARYPKWVDVLDMDNHFCGEFVSEQDYKAACEGKW